MMLRMMRSRGRKMMMLKMMMLRRLMLRRRTDPKNGTQTFVRAFAVEMHMDVAEEPLRARIYRKMPGPRSATHTCAVEKHFGHFTRAILCENIQEKCRRPAGAP